MTTWKLPWMGLVAMTVVACQESTLGPEGDAPAPAGIDFGLEEGTPGAHYADRHHPSTAAPLAGEFAVALPDSLGGLILLSYDGETSDLFILQVSAAEPGTYPCGPVESGPPCHARLFENVRAEGGVIEVDGRLDLTSGTLTLGGVGPEDVWGSFEGRLERTAGEGVPGIDIFHGTILVDLLPGPIENGSLGCLIELTVGATSCT